MADLRDGESVEVKGSAAKPYVIKNTGGVYSCSCPAWRNQSLPIEQRTCKHLRRLRGDEAEKERTGGALSSRAVKTCDPDKKTPPLLLAEPWDNASDLSGWWISEKLDGVRAYWDGSQLLSRLGNPYHAPDWFVAGLPTVPLDGELWLDRGAFQRTVSIVRRQDKSDHWRQIRYLVFDAPASDESFETRLQLLEEQLAELAEPDRVQLLEHQRCTGLDHLREELSRIESLGGEGLMLRQPGSHYEVGRSATLLKVKSFHDQEATVIGHQPGRGKLKGMLGALEVQLADGTQFKVGTGFTEAQRATPPALGSIISFRYQELSDGGVPRFPSFIRVLSDGDGGQPSPVTMVAAPQAPATDGGSTGPRYFELVSDTSSKFWEIATSGCEVTVRYGRIGTSGQTKSKSFSDEQAALRHADKLIGQKTGKGYTEVLTT